VMDGPRKMWRTCTCVGGWEMDWGGRGNRRARARSGVWWWRDVCSEDVHNLYVESGGAGTGSGRERDTWAIRELQSIAIV